MRTEQKKRCVTKLFVLTYPNNNQDPTSNFMVFMVGFKAPLKISHLAPSLIRLTIHPATKPQQKNPTLLPMKYKNIKFHFIKPQLYFHLGYKLYKRA